MGTTSPSRLAGRCGRRGFTLLEVLIALCILGGSVVVLMGNINHSVRVYRVAREMAFASNLAQAKLQSILTSRDPIRAGNESGRIKDDPRFAFHVSITETTLPGFEKDDLKGILRIEVVVTWDSPERRVRLVQLTGSERGAQ